MASSSTSNNDHAAAGGMSIPVDFATPTPEGRARYEQNIRDMVDASEQTEARVRQMRERESVAAFLENDRGKAASKQTMELYADEAEVENRMRAAVVENMHRCRPVLAPGARVSLVAHPIDPNGGGRGSIYAMAGPRPTHFFRSATKAELRRQAEDNAAFAHPDSRDPVAIVAAGAPNRLPAQHARDVRAEKMAHIEQCIQIVGDSTINAFDHVRIGRMIAGLVGRMERGELGPDECKRLHAISASYDRLVVTFVSPLHHRRGRPRKQARTHRRGKPDVRMAPTEPSAAAASDRSRMDAQPRPKKGAWPVFHCKRCPINGRATPTELPYGTLSRDVLCDMCAVQMHAGDALAHAASGQHEAIRQAADSNRTGPPLIYGSEWVDIKQKITTGLVERLCAHDQRMAIDAECAAQMHAGDALAHAASGHVAASGFTRTDEQMAFHEAIRQAGEEARAAAAAGEDRPDSPRPPMAIHPNGNVENYNDHAYLKACLPLVYGPDWERMSNAVVSEFSAQSHAATAVAAAAASHPTTPERMALDADCVAAMQADERAVAASRHAWDANPALRDRETVGFTFACKGQPSTHLESMNCLWKEHTASTGPSEFSRRMRTVDADNASAQAATTTTAAAAAAAPRDTPSDEWAVLDPLPVRLIDGEWMTVDPLRAMDTNPVLRVREVVGAIRGHSQADEGWEPNDSRRGAMDADKLD